MSQRSYKRLSLKEREEISRSLAQGISFRSIAGLLERDVSTISREINLASMNKHTYRAERSQRRANRNASKRRKDKTKLSMSPELWDYVRQKLLLLWSPEQIAQIIKKSILMKGICEYRMRQYTHTCMLCQKANSRNDYWGSYVVRENVVISALMAWGSPASSKTWL